MRVVSLRLIPFIFVRPSRFAPAVVAIAALLAVACAPADDGPPTYFEDPDLQRIYSRMMEEMAPDRGWERVRYIAFDRVVDRGGDVPSRRGHRWDVWGGMYRMVGDAGGQEMVAVIDTNDPTGNERIWLDGELVTDPALSDSLADRAHGSFINDTYWFLMPYKWADPGVNTVYLGERGMDGRAYEVVELTFDAVGRTPQNKYRGWVDPETGLMAYWQHWRNASDPEPAFTLAWTEWTRYGPLLLSPARPDSAGYSRVNFENMEASLEMPEGMFEGPGG